MYKIISLYYNIKYIVCIDYKTSFFFLFSLRPSSSSSSFFGYKISKLKITFIHIIIGRTVAFQCPLEEDDININ